jgi:hypothetical protein
LRAGQQLFNGYAIQASSLIAWFAVDDFPSLPFLTGFDRCIPMNFGLADSKSLFALDMRYEMHKERFGELGILLHQLQEFPVDLVVATGIDQDAGWDRIIV